MASLGARPKQKIATTYGKSTRRTNLARPAQPTAKSNRAGLSRSVTEAPAATRSDEPDPWSFPGDDSSPEPVKRNGNTKTALLAKNGGQGNTERKRKIAQVYPVNDVGQDLSEDSSPAASRPKQRSRVSSPTDNVGVGRKSNDNPRQARSLSADMDLDRPDGPLSSPPPTPTAPKENKVRSREGPKGEVPFSPNTMQILDHLQLGDKRPRPHQIPVRPKYKQIPVRPRSKQSTVGSVKPQDIPQAVRLPAISATSEPKPAKKPRRKLIDALVEQMEDSDDPVDEGKTSSQVSWTEPVVSSSQTTESPDSQSPFQTPRTRRTYGSTASRTLARSGSSLKHTYGSSKVTLLEEDNILDALVVPEETGFSARRRLELTPKKLPKSTLDPEDDPDSTSARKILDIHELKKAGANSRVADEMFDLSSQIGQPSVKPSSERRTALLQIADKTQHKDFRQRIRDHGLDAMILKNVRNETDPISGYLISAILLQILASSPAPHIIQILQSEDAGHLFGRLLQLGEDTAKLARERKSNLSKRNQGFLLNVQTTLLKLSVWQPAKPTSTSPRTVALKCLETMINQDAHLGSDDALFPPTVTKGLFDTLVAAQEADFWTHAAPRDAFDIRCSLSVLEYHAVKVMEAQSGEQLAAEYLPSIADAFGVAIRDPTRHSDLESPLLKLVLNMTNSSVTAPDIFVAKDLILPLSTSICASFDQSLSVVAGGEELTEELLNGLVLRLGILINFTEQSTAVREAVHKSRKPGGGPPTKELIQLFLANHRATAEADSEAKSQLNVAFGYLSVLLGYLCLYAPIRKEFRSSHSAKSMGPLVDSIQEFISHHRAMEASLLDAGADDPRAHGGYTERLQGLVDQLDADAAYD
ncbi:rheb small monomeric gtpase [Seiridium cupressi]